VTARGALVVGSVVVSTLLLGCKSSSHDVEKLDATVWPTYKKRDAQASVPPDTAEPASGPDAETPSSVPPDAAPVASCIVNPDDLIADFSTDNSLNPADGRKGGWYVNGDDEGTFDPPKVANEAYPIDEANGNTQCSGPGSFHTRARGFASWGAGMSTDLAPKDGNNKGYYDASRYRGLSFWAKAGAPLTGVHISISDIYTDGGADPSTVDPAASACMYASGSIKNCSPYLVKLGDGTDFPLYKNRQIDTTWRRFDIMFADMRQDRFNPGFHTEADRLDSKHLTALAIQVGTLYVNDRSAPNDFELWIDDVTFIR
jgi:hypothetical protein